MTTTAAASAAAGASTVIADITNNVKCTKLLPQNEKDSKGKKSEGSDACQQSNQIRIGFLQEWKSKRKHDKDCMSQKVSQYDGS